MQPEYNDQPLAAQAESAAETMKRVERELRSPAVPFETGAGVSKMPGQLPSQQATARMTAGPLSAMGVAAADPQTQALQALIAQGKLNVGPVEVGYQRAQPMAQGARPQQTVSVGGRPFDADTYFAAQASQGPGGRSYGATVGRDGLNAYGQYNPARKDVNVGMQFQRAFADGGPVMPSSDPMEGFSIDPEARPAMQPQSRVGTGIGGALSRMGQGISDYVTADPTPSPRELLEARMSEQARAAMDLSGLALPDRAVDVKADELGSYPVDAEGNRLKFLRRSLVLPMASGEGEKRLAMPMILDIAGNLMSGAAPAVKGSGVVLGSGPVRRGAKAGVEAAEDTVKLFHGTTEEGYKGITSSNKIEGPVYLTPRSDVAKDYSLQNSSDPYVVEVNVPKSKLMIDFDLPGGRLLDVESANSYSGNIGWTIDDYLSRGYSVGVNDGVPIAARGDAPNPLEKAGVEAGAKQAISSADTSINQVPALFKSKVFDVPEGTRNLDIGGGKYDKGTDYLAAERGVESYVYDPFNRTPEHNKLVLDQFADNPADTVTAANVLNVIKEPEARLDVIQQAFDNLKPGGKAYFDIYEGSKSGVGKETTKGWQNNMKAADFQDEIAAVFSDVERKGSMLIATKAPPSPVMQAFNDTPEPAALRDSVVSKIAQSIDDSAGDTAKLPTVSGLGPQYIVDSGVEDVVKKNSFLLASTKNNNAEKQLNGVASLLDEFPDMALDPEQWVRGFSKATGERNVIAPPYRFMKAIADGEYTELLRGLTPGQISDADAGFAAGKDFLKAYHAGQMGVEDTGKMFMWGIMSRGVNPFTHEGLFLDAFNGIEPWIKMAAEGKFTKEVAEGAYKDWAATTAPKGSGQPGSGAMHNLNAFGKDFLLKMSQPDKAGVTPLQKLHDLMADPSKSGRDIRREFARVGEGVGIDNKVVSFILLATGRDDVMVIDRIQLKNLWDDGRYADTNIWDGISVPTVTLKDDTVKRFAPTDEGRAAAKSFAAANPGAKGGTAVVTGSSLAEATYGAKGILIYEAIEDALMKSVDKIYSDLGRPDAASPGRFHWETWVARSNHEASHGTLPAILKKVQGSNNPLADVYSKQGDYQSYAYGAKYMRDAEGKPMFAIPLSSGAEITMTPQQYQSALAQMRKPKYGVVPKNFKVTETEGMPWYEREGVNRSKLDAILRAAAGQEGAIRKALGGPISYGSGDRAGGRSATGVEAPQAGVNINQATQEVLSEIRQKADEGNLDQRKIAYLIRMSATGTFKPESAYDFAGEILEGDLEAIRDRFAKFPRTLRILSRLDRALGGEAGRQYGVAANPRQDWQPIPLDGATEGFAKGGKVKARKPARVGSKGAMEEFSALAERMYGAKVAKNIIGRSDNTPTKVMFAMNQYAKNLMLSNPQRYAAGYKAQLRELNEIAKKYKIGARQAFNRGEDVDNTKKELNEALQSKPARDNAAFSDAIKRLLYILR